MGEFLRCVAKGLAAPAAAEVAELQALKAAREGGAALEAWDLPFYSALARVTTPPRSSLAP